MLTLEQIRIKLSDRLTAVVAAAIEVHPETIRRIKRGQNASYNVLKKLSDYLTGGSNG